jgi:hypothetical protein
MLQNCNIKYQYKGIWNHLGTTHLELGVITVGVHKRNVSPQNLSQNITLNDHYIYEVIYLVDFFFSLGTHILLD